jgi:hypothetical protein
MDRGENLVIREQIVDHKQIHSSSHQKTVAEIWPQQPDLEPAHR